MTSHSVKKTVFNVEWTSKQLHPDFASRCQEVKHQSNAAYCSLCKTVFSLSNMGRQAVASHMKSVKHVKAASYALTPTLQGTLACFVTAARTVPSSDAVEKRENAVSSPVSSTNASDAATSIALV